MTSALAIKSRLIRARPAWFSCCVSSSVSNDCKREVNAERTVFASHPPPRHLRTTPNGGLILVRELDERLGLGELIERHLTDGRGKNTQLPLTDLVRQSVYSRLAG